ncbi:MAG: hypothetical protein ABII23_06075 [bacterium]
MEKNKKHSLEYIIKHTKIIQMPHHLLATFAVTDLNYHFVAGLSPGSARLRQGIIRAEKPKIISPYIDNNMLEGFDDDAKQMIDEIAHMLGTDLRILGYHFKNEHNHTTLEHSSAETIIERLKVELEDKPRTVIIKGFDQAWQLGLLKVIVEHATKSFPANVKELEERGFFPDTEGILDRTRWKIDILFRKAQKNPDAIKELGRFLKEHNLFSDYEDRFFALVKKIKSY